MLKKILCTFLFSLIAVSLVFGATTGKIAGRVVDAQTGEPMAGANVVIDGTNQGAAADLNGDYYILNVRPGTYSVLASMVGYADITVTDVVVNVDRTIRVDIEMMQTTLETEEITVVADRDVIRHDVSNSAVNASQAQILETPMVVDVTQYMNLQAGIETVVDEDGNEQMLIRGGGMDQTGLVVDGLTMNNNEANEPMNIVNLSAIEEVNIIKGGFNAEYGNIRSGLINVVTKEGAQYQYNGSIDFRYGFAQQKHRGESLYSKNNFYLRPYLDPEVAFVGTDAGVWNSYTQGQYPAFMGWDQYVVANNLDLTPQEAYNIFMWEHTAEGSDALGHPHAGEYGDKPDLNLDLSFGGPVPGIGEYLSFFASFRNADVAYALPRSLDYLNVMNTYLKFNSHLQDNMKLGLEFMYGEESNDGSNASNLGEGGRGSYFLHGSSPMDIYRSMIGITFDHVLSPSTFYNVRISRVYQKNHASGPYVYRDKTPLVTFTDDQGDPVYVLDERPWGYDPVQGYQYALGDNMVLGGVGGGWRDFTKVETWNIKVDYTSQLNKFNQFKAGIEVVSDNYSVFRGEDGLDPTGNFTVKWDQTPLRFGIYVQDKIEYEGMIANVGVRMDINDPNTDWYTVDPYSKYFSRPYKQQLNEAETEPASGNVHIAPRVGISHPITERSKIYFNYGHFYSMPSSWNMYEINSGVQGEGLAFLGNPNLLMPRTIGYELGYEHEIGDQYLITVAGYYRDVTDQIGDVEYISRDRSVYYTTQSNDHYEDIRGFEITFEKRWGDWVTGWLNYNYMVVTEGLLGREAQYEDPNEQRIYGLRNPMQEKPLPQPYANASIQVRSPKDWGPTIGDYAVLDMISVNLLAYWRTGEYLTWEPEPPYKEFMNLQWKDIWEFDLRIMKHISIDRYQFDIFLDIQNVFDIQYLTGSGFDDEWTEDWRDYMNSLHLPMYSEAKYQQTGQYTAGDDKVGDVWSEDKPYINMPNIDFLAWNRPRSFVLGLRFSF